MPSDAQDRQNAATHSCTRKRVCSFVKGTMAGVSDEAAQEIQMPVGPQMLENAEEPMTASSCNAQRSKHSQSDRDATQSDTLSESPWCRTRFTTSRTVEIDAVAPQTSVRLWVHGREREGGEGPVQTVCSHEE